MPRRGECIYKRKDGRWEGRYIVKYDSNGKAKYASVYSNSYFDVKHKLLEKKQGAKTQNINSDISLRELLYLWLDNNRHSLKAQTFNKYKRLIETHIVPNIGTIKLANIDNITINNFLYVKSQNGRLDGTGGLSFSYIKTISFILYSALKFAASKDLCSYIKGEVIRMPKAQKTLEVLSVVEQRQLEKYIENRNDDVAIGILLSLYAGLRIGEVCGLKWEDVNLCERTIHVHRTVYRLDVSDNNINKAKTMLVVGNAKTNSSDRILPIPEKLYQMLEKMFTRDVEFVVSGKTYPYTDPRTYQYAFKRCLTNSGIRDINYHTLRHTFATRCIESGMDIKSLSELLGHASVNITLNTYVHSSMEHKRKQLDKMTSFCGQ